MLTFYYHPLSPIARRVWLALLEKEISFEPVVVDLRGKQFEDSYLAVNPFHHVPAIVHEGVSIIESLAILDYLEMRFSERPLSEVSASDPLQVAKLRMVQMVVMNELVPKLMSYAIADEDNPIPDSVLDSLNTCFTFLEQQLDARDFFGGSRLNLADIVAGATVPLFVRLGYDLQPYSGLEAWHRRIVSRAAWQQTNPTEAQLRIWQKWLRLRVKRRSRRAK